MIDYGDGKDLWITLSGGILVREGYELKRKINGQI